MTGISRRAVLAGTGALAALACGGEVPVAADPPPAPAPDPAPAPPRRPRRSTRPNVGGDPGTIFRPDASLTVPALSYLDPPAWFRRAGGLWCPNPQSAGSSLLQFVKRNSEGLCALLGNFRELPKLLEGARAQGTDILYLIDYYEGNAEQDCATAWRNKAMYVPRADLGGAEALRDGIAAVKKAGGHVILYVEPFILEKQTPLAEEHGKAWAILREDGYPDDPYPSAWKLCPAVAEVRAHFAQVAGRLVGEYGASGVHLDSFGNQRGWRCIERTHGHAIDDGEVFDDGVKRLVAEVHAEMMRHDPEAVLLCEGSKLGALSQWISGSQDWGVPDLVTRFAWKNVGRQQLLVNGFSLDDTHQVLALGHKVTIGADYYTRPPDGRLVHWIDGYFRDGIPDRADDRGRRYLCEDVFREMNRYRNAGLLLERAMPNLERATPRRWERPAAFESNAAMRTLLEECRDLAERIDQALAGVTEMPDQADYIRSLLEARTAFDVAVRGGEITPLEAPSPDSAAYRFDSRTHRGVSVVNVGTTTLQTAVRAGNGTFEDLLEGGTIEAKGGLRVQVPPHSVRFYLTTA
jgi:hypothetical protein